MKFGRKFRFNLDFRPKLVDSLKDYNRQKLRADITAGITVGIVALPLAIAFAIASGVKPEAGIFTAIIAGFIISALGGSRVQVGGPTGAFVVIVYGIVHDYGVANLLICTIMAGFMLLAMGVFRMGSLIKYIPNSIVSGFTTGIAVLIGLSQIKDFMGLKTDELDSEFFTKISQLWHALPTVDWLTTLVAVLAFFLVRYWPARFSRVPGSIVVVVLGIVAAMFLPLDIETIGTRFGGIPQTLPAFATPDFSLSTLRNLINPAFTIALLGAIESLLSARIADSMIGDRHDPNQELKAQGIANIITPFFGGIPATGAIARTAVNIKCHAVSPVAGIVHSLTLLAIVLVAAPLAKYIPLAVLSAVLLNVAINMIDWAEFSHLRRFTAGRAIILLTTFFLTLFFDLTVAVEFGMVLAALFFIFREADLTQITELEATDIDSPLAGRKIPDGVRVFQLYGSLFFGAVGKLEALLDTGRSESPDATLYSRVLILEMHQVVNLDSTGLDMLGTVQRTLAREHTQLLFSGLNRQPLMMIRRSGFITQFGVTNILPDLDAALKQASELLMAMPDANTAGHIST